MADASAVYFLGALSERTDHGLTNLIEYGAERQTAELADHLELEVQGYFAGIFAQRQKGPKDVIQSTCSGMIPRLSSKRKNPFSDYA